MNEKIKAIYKTLPLIDRARNRVKMDQVLEESRRNRQAEEHGNTWYQIYQRMQQLGK